jgi:hypothetical protein
MADPLTLAIGAGVGGIGSYLEGLSQEEIAKKNRDQQQQQLYYQLLQYAQGAGQQRADKAAQGEYLQQNLTPFEGLKDYKFDPSKYEDVLEPARAYGDKALLATRNLAALQGRARGGQALQASERQAAQQAQDYSKLLTGLGRQDEEKMYQRALQKYAQDVARHQMIGGTKQGAQVNAEAALQAMK